MRNTRISGNTFKSSYVLQDSSKDVKLENFDLYASQI